jgi:Type II secretion system (T2SS), protein G
MTLHTPILVLLAATLALMPREAGAWSSRASKTELNILLLRNATEEYRAHLGVLPNPCDFQSVIQSERYLIATDQRNPFLDAWGREIIYRNPGIHDEFDLYSAGEDGIDNKGAKDDVSSWLGVNDGYYYKRYWPQGRFTVIVSCALGVVILMARAISPWRIVIPIAGMVVSFGVSLGCYWLLHPGRVPSRNQPLSMIIGGSVFVSLVLLANLWMTTYKNHKAQQVEPRNLHCQK